ncbi:hypothetical protein SAMN02745857_03576 [Andreprevotia lacus DSM 23236]|jgi:hypothetical protein|uniref:Uncharacterized protein n=1 Tax=Andreprevotia lacus DSM 23236 TaxID=1121001 RepID=A0A1W1XYX9_9NEIS|nr:hypothetical protein [Andreprevotia lacus]SMC29074.1 hypothetical protein SAMN02745857_03576 [Andreprevotia lacus DSM 23236]
MSTTPRRTLPLPLGDRLVLLFIAVLAITAAWVVGWLSSWSAGGEVVAVLFLALAGGMLWLMVRTPQLRLLDDGLQLRTGLGRFRWLAREQVHALRSQPDVAGRRLQLLDAAEKLLAEVKLPGASQQPLPGWLGELPVQQGLPELHPDVAEDRRLGSDTAARVHTLLRAQRLDLGLRIAYLLVALAGLFLPEWLWLLVAPLILVQLAMLQLGWSSAADQKNSPPLQRQTLQLLMACATFLIILSPLKPPVLFDWLPTLLCAFTLGLLGCVLLAPAQLRCWPDASRSTRMLRLAGLWLVLSMVSGGMLLQLTPQLAATPAAAPQVISIGALALPCAATRCPKVTLNLPTGPVTVTLLNPANQRLAAGQTACVQQHRTMLGMKWYEVRPAGECGFDVVQ